MTQINRILATAALAVASFAATAGGDYHAKTTSTGSVSGVASASATTAAGQMGAAYSFAAGSGQAKFGSQAFDVSSSGVAWNQSTGGATGTAASRGTAAAAITAGTSRLGGYGQGTAGYDVAAGANQGLAAAGQATGAFTFSGARGDLRVSYTADALATKGAVTVDGQTLAAGTGMSMASAVAGATAGYVAHNPSSHDGD